MTKKLGWIGVGRMGSAMVRRLLLAGSDVTVWNRTRSKADELIPDGAKVAERLTDLADRDIVFVMVSTPKDLEQVVLGPDGVLSGPDAPSLFKKYGLSTQELVDRAWALLGRDGPAPIVEAAPVAEGEYAPV